MTERDEVVAEIRRALKARSGKSWSVKCGRGTVWGWITITAPPKRLDQYGGMTSEDRAELSDLLGMEVHHQGAQVPASSDYRREYIDRANGRAGVAASPYWD